MSKSLSSHFENPAPGLTVRELAALEEESGVTLPSTLRQLYAAVGGGKLCRGLLIDKDEKYFDVHELIAARPSRLHCGFVVVYQDLVKRRRLLPEHLIPFARESGGNFYLMHCGDESIWYASMELDNGALPAPERIAESLIAFLDELRCGEDE